MRPYVKQEYGQMHKENRHVEYALKQLHEFRAQRELQFLLRENEHRLKVQ